MLLGFLTVLVMLLIGAAYLREGLFTSFLMCCNVFLAGLLAFNFWEPLANAAEPGFRGTMLHGYEDSFFLILVFSITLGALRVITNFLSRTQIRFRDPYQQIGGALFGLATGYLVSGFLICTFQTLPWHENFMYFNPKVDADGGLRRVLPPDRVWLAMMHRAGAYAFSSDEDPRQPAGKLGDRYVEKYKTFDKYGTFEQRYARFRRYGDAREAAKYVDEFDQEK